MRPMIRRTIPLLVALALACGDDGSDRTSGTSTVDEAGATPASGSVGSSATSPSSPELDIPEGTTVHVYKPTYCGCCTDWVDHMERAGFDVSVETTDRPAVIKDELGVPEELRSCHTSRVGEYVVEGHVPAEVVARLLKERPDVKGIAVPGMPIGSPGMEATDGTSEPYDIVAFDDSGESTVYESR